MWKSTVKNMARYVWLAGPTQCLGTERNGYYSGKEYRNRSKIISCFKSSVFVLLDLGELGHGLEIHTMHLAWYKLWITEFTFSELKINKGLLLQDNITPSYWLISTAEYCVWVETRQQEIYQPLNMYVGSALNPQHQVLRGTWTWMVIQQSITAVASSALSPGCCYHSHVSLSNGSSYIYGALLCQA